MGNSEQHAELVQNKHLAVFGARKMQAIEKWGHIRHNQAQTPTDGRDVLC